MIAQPLLVFWAVVEPSIDERGPVSWDLKRRKVSLGSFGELRVELGLTHNSLYAVSHGFGVASGKQHRVDIVQ